MLDLNNLEYTKNIEYIKENVEESDVLEIFRELIENGIISLNVERCKQYDIPENYLSAPFRVFYDITYKCNLRCKHCFTSSGIQKKDELTIDEKIKLVEQLSKLGVERVSIAGGEPFVSEDLYKFIEKCNEKDIDVSISTNATLFTNEVIDKINKLKIKNITVSFDGRYRKKYGFYKRKWYISKNN